MRTKITEEFRDQFCASFQSNRLALLFGTCRHFSKPSTLARLVGKKSNIQTEGLELVCHRFPFSRHFLPLHYSRTPGNSKSEGKRKTVRVSGVSSYRGRLKYSIFQVNNYSLLIFSSSVYNTVQIKLISRETYTLCDNCNDYAFLRQCNTVNVT